MSRAARAPHAHRADCSPVAQHRHAGHTPEAARLGLPRDRVLRVLEDIRNGRAVFRQHRSASGAAMAWSHRVHAAKGFGPLRSYVRQRDEMNELAVEPEDSTDAGRAQPHRPPAIVSNTGWTSVGDREITWRISAVAVC